jgi:hypothetical protein
MKMPALSLKGKKSRHFCFRKMGIDGNSNASSGKINKFPEVLRPGAAQSTMCAMLEQKCLLP